MAKGLSSYWETALKFGLSQPMVVADIATMLNLVEPAPVGQSAKEGDVAVVTATAARYVKNAVFTPGHAIGDWTLVASQNAADIVNVPAGTVAAATVQAAIDELDAEKFALDGSLVMAGNINMGGGSIGNGGGCGADTLVLVNELRFTLFANVQMLDFYVINHDAANILANAVNLEAIAVAGVAVGDHVIGCYCVGMEANVMIGCAYVSGAAQITVPMGNPTGLAIDPAAHDYVFVVLRATT